MNGIASLKSSAGPLVRKVLFLSVALALLIALGVTPAQAAATTVTTSFSEPTELYLYIPCAAGGAGEFVYLSGPLHMLFVTVIDGQGGFHGKYHFQPQGITGTGETTGAKYQATGETQETFNGKVGIQDTYVNNFKIIGQGTGNNFLIHETYHITVNADGTVTAYVDNFSAECR